MADGTTAGPILLVEDDRPLAEALSRYLTAHGRDVHIADSAESAEQLLASGLRPGLVILDLNLPGETGLGLLRGGALAKAGSPPVVIATATSVSPRTLAEFGIAGYLPKPFPMETLLTCVNRLSPVESATAR